MKPITKLVRLREGKPPLPPPVRQEQNSDPVLLEQLLQLLQQRFVLYYPVFRDVTGSPNAALMLGHMLYWTRNYLAHHPERQGWFWHTAIEWTQATGLSRREQDTARACLRNSGLVEECLKGVPARKHYRVRLNDLAKRLSNKLQRSSGQQPLSWSDIFVRELLGRPIAFLRVFAEITDNTAAALYLSDLCQQRRYFNEYRSHADVDGTWMQLQLKDAAARLGYSEKVLRSARSILLAQGLIEERYTKGLRPQILTRIQLREIHRRVQLQISKNEQKQQQAIDSKGLAYSHNPDLPKAPNCKEPNSQTRPSQSAKQEEPKTPNKDGDKVISIKRFTTTKGFSLFKQLQQVPEGVCSSGEKENGITEKPLDNSIQRASLLLPKSFADEQKASAFALVAKLPVEQQQVVLDEWVGQLRQSGKVSNPLGYLVGMVRNAVAGSFMPTLALKIKEEREQAAIRAAAQQNREQQMAQKIQEQASPAEPTTTVSTSRERVRQLMQDAKAMPGISKYVKL